MIQSVLFVVLLVGGCSSAAADHERLGDRAYGEGRFSAAVAEYRAAAKSAGGARPRLWAKIGAAALRGEDLGTAVDAYSELGASDPARAAEAAAGLDRVAQRAERAGPAAITHLAAAVRALRRIAPGRPLGRFALAPTSGLSATEALGAIPAALASASDGRTVDSLLVAYGHAQRITTACDAATNSFRTVLRRTHDQGLQSQAAEGIGSCALRLGLDALASDQPGEAERWFESAATAAPGTPSGWRAAIGLGDARLSQGDLLGAAIAYQRLLSATGVPDSLVKLASGKLNALATPPPAAPEGALR